MGRAFNTEKAYVQKVRAFMADRGLKNLADFGPVSASDVEAHLTDLAVDGDVAPSTQDHWIDWNCPGPKRLLRRML